MIFSIQLHDLDKRFYHIKQQHTESKNVSIKLSLSSFNSLGQGLNWFFQTANEIFLLFVNSTDFLIAKFFAHEFWVCGFQGSVLESFFSNPQTSACGIIYNETRRCCGVSLNPSKEWLMLSFKVWWESKLCNWKMLSSQ